MNIEIKTLTKKITDLLHTVVQPKYVRNPSSDWFKMLCIFAILGLGVIGLDGYLFYELTQGNLFSESSVTAQKVATFDRVLLKQETDFYTAQTAAFQAAQTATSTQSSIDPSL